MAAGTTPPASPTAGTAVFAGTGSSATATGLSPATAYSFAVWVTDRTGLLSTPATATLAGTVISPNAVSATTVRFGATVTVTGALRRSDSGAPIAGAQVGLYGRRVGTTTWQLLGTATSNADGELSRGHQPQWNLDYRWQYAGSPAHIGSVGPALAVGVRPRITAALSAPTVALGGSVILSGDLTPPHPGQTIRLQQLIGSTWTTIASKALAGDSTYTFTITPTARGTISYRTYRPADADNLSGNSSTLTLTVT
jgi:hypothetical protein